MMSEKNPLASYFYQNRRNIIHKWPHYFDIYHRYFSRYINTDCVIVEIGVYQGGSLQMWKNYFGEKAKIVGIDINPDCKKYENENIQVFIGSQSDTDFLEELTHKLPRIDVLIDDGGHLMHQQMTSFKALFNHIKDDGIYLCEDTYTSYLPTHGGGYIKQGTFIEFAKSLVDHIHAWHIPENAFPPTSYTRSINSVHFYDSIVVVEKKRRVQPWSEMYGAGLNEQHSPIGAEYVERFRLKLKLLGVAVPDNEDVGHLMTNQHMLQSYLGKLYEGKIWPEKGDTMIGYLRLNNLGFCIQQVLADKIPGDFIETGVWRGGACIFMAALLRQYGEDDRNVWLADSFAGLPQPNPDRFPADLNDTHHQHEILAVSEEVVLRNFTKYNIPITNVRILKGWFKDSLPHAPVNQLAILRLDGDMYESTIDALYYLYPKLEKGGYCIIDDWGAVPACRKAVEDYRRIMDVNEQIQGIDWTGVYWRKEKRVLPVSRNDFLDLLR
jgi:cephalosporin hydroxylase